MVSGPGGVIGVVTFGYMVIELNQQILLQSFFSSRSRMQGIANGLSFGLQ